MAAVRANLGVRWRTDDSAEGVFVFGANLGERPRTDVHRTQKPPALTISRIPKRTRAPILRVPNSPEPQRHSFELEPGVPIVGHWVQLGESNAVPRPSRRASMSASGEIRRVRNASTKGSQFRIQIAAPAFFARATSSKLSGNCLVRQTAGRV